MRETAALRLLADRRAVMGGGAAIAAAAALSGKALGGAARDPASAIVELRQYTLHPGRRDDLIALFDREFLEPQEEAGARIIGEFRDLDRADRFVWLRGFQGMAAREVALTDFYSGPVWQAHRAAANETMIDSDNVFLLKPARPGAGFQNEDAPRPPRGATATPETVVTASIWSFSAPVCAELASLFDREAAPLLNRYGAPAVAMLTTESAANNFPALPVREGENVFVWFSVFATEKEERAAAARLEASPQWNAVLDAFAYDFERAPETLRLAPTERSRPLA